MSKNSFFRKSVDSNSQFYLEQLEDRVMLSSVTRIRVDAIGETGQEILQLQIDGQAVQDFTFDSAGQEQVLLFETDAAVDSSQVNLVFLNDAFDPATGFDRNVDVSQFQVIDVDSDSREIFNIGTAEGALVRTGDNLNVANSGTVASSPVGQAPPTQAPPVVQADPGTRIRVDAKGETGEEILQLRIDGQAVQDFTFSTPGQEEVLLFETNEVIDSSRVSFVFLNDLFDPATGFDRNVDVSQFQVIDLGSDTREIFNIGTAEGSLAFTGDTLNVANSGTVASSPDGQAPPVQAPPVVQADPGTRIRVDAKGETGEEILQLRIDGQAVQDFTFSTPGQEEVLLFETNEVIDSSRVSFVFLNDLFDPATGFDRNVDVSQFQVIDLGSDTREIFNIGTAEGSLAFTGDTLNVANSGTVASSPDGQAPPVAPPVQAPPVAQADPGTRIRVNATGETAEEILQLQIDGQTVQEFTFDAAGQEQLFVFETAEVVDPSRVRFAFPNDAFDPATGFDRNIDVRTFQTIDLASSNRQIFDLDTANGSLAFSGDSLGASNATVRNG